jgi:hypothetical protein
MLTALVVILICLVLCLIAQIINFILDKEEKEKPVETGENDTYIVPSDTYPVNYDPTSGEVTTHLGKGKYIAYNGNTGKVTVEMDYGYLVELDGKGCFIDERV